MTMQRPVSDPVSRHARGESRRPRASRASLACAAALLVAVVLSAGCPSSHEPLLIPAFDTAREQYAFAEAQRRRALPSLDEEKRSGQMEEIIALYEEVPKRFPDDRQFTPLAKLKLGQLMSRTPIAENKRDALAILEECEKEYRENDEVLAFALYEQGKLLDQIGNYELAQRKYREVFDRFAAHGTPELRDLAGKARNRYNRVRTRSNSGI